MIYWYYMTDIPGSVKREIEEKKRIVGVSRIDQERWRKKNVGETEDRLDAIGNPSEKIGIKATQEAYEEYRAEEFSKKTDRINWLNEKSKYSFKKRTQYFRYVNTLVQYELSYLDVPPGYMVKSEVTQSGIKFIVTDRWGDIRLGGFAPCGLGLYDEQACRTSVNKIDDLITQLENHPKNGIYLP
jgi:hypothetical protein